MIRKATATWTGNGKEGKGRLDSASGVLKDTPYGFNSRFEDGPGSNPEELLAAAHAGCFTMALSLILQEAGYAAERMDTSAEVTLEQVEGGFAITAIRLTLRAAIPDIEDRLFHELAGKAKAGCPVSKALNPEITLDAALV